MSQLRNEIGIDNICWEADYPHSDSMWPGAPEQLREVLSANNVPDDEINKMTYENAMRWYHFDPFTHIPKDQATVGALRKAAEGHDVSVQALSHREKTRRHLRRLRGECQEADRQYGLSPDGVQVFAPVLELTRRRPRSARRRNELRADR